MSTFQFTGYVGREPEVKNVNGSKLLSVSVAYSTGKDDPTLWVWKGRLNEPLESDSMSVVWVCATRGAEPLWVEDSEGSH